MTNTSQARKRQRRNRRRSAAEAKAEAQRVSERIAEDIELGRYGRLRMCTRKQGYETELEAISAAIGSSWTFGHPFRYYRCPYCRQWHLTSVDEGEDSECTNC